MNHPRDADTREMSHTRHLLRKLVLISLRDASSADFPAILALNHTWVHFLSPLSLERLNFLHQESCYHRVVESDGEVLAFLLCIGKGSAYDSVNYTWFNSRYEQFIYVDRIVVSDQALGQGLGARLYDDLFEFAKRVGAKQVTAEFDIDPPNPGSKRFHERFGFKEVGSQRVANGSKWVSLQSSDIA
jgi:uncharacterized protein